MCAVWVYQLHPQKAAKRHGFAEILAKSHSSPESYNNGMIFFDWENVLWFWGAVFIFAMSQ